MAAADSQSRASHGSKNGWLIAGVLLLAACSYSEVRLPAAPEPLSTTDADAGELPSGDSEAQHEAGAEDLGLGGTAPRVRLQSGELLGRLEGTTHLFLGIPYAKPPVGPLRFAPPEPAQPWTGALDATTLGPQCPQTKKRGKMPGGLSADGEDCLRLNVWAPQQATGAPVIVFVHGGSFRIGSGNDLDGRMLSEASGSIVVSINYRLGVLGHLLHPALDQVLALPSGNLSLRDQQLALRWVRDNIAAFGGDPNAVTMMGAAAGAQSVCLHLFAQGSEQLAQRAILQSGTCVRDPALPMRRERVAKASEQLISELCEGQDVVTCLRELPVETLASWDRLPSHMGEDFLPQVDGSLIREDPTDALLAGRFQRMPILLGTNHSEWTVQVLRDPGDLPHPKSLWDLMVVTRELYPEDVSDVLLHYVPGTTDKQADALLGRIVSDSWFHCPARFLARTASAHGAAVYLYSFDLAPAAHGQELDYVFGTPHISPVLTPPLVPSAAPVPLEEELVSTMQHSWSSFARHGSPSTQHGEWPAYDATLQQYMMLDRELRVGTAYWRDSCDMWDRLFARAQKREAQANSMTPSSTRP